MGCDEGLRGIAIGCDESMMKDSEAVQWVVMRVWQRIERCSNECDESVMKDCEQFQWIDDENNILVF